MRFTTLGSGSRGNAALVELASTRLLVDAGLSARGLERRLKQVGVEPSDLDGLLLSHEHEDHARGVERFSRQHGVPVFCAPETLEALDLSPIHLASWQPLRDGERLELDGIAIEPFPVPHDAVRPVGFVLTGEGIRIGVATDLGHATPIVRDRLWGCDLLVVESNHDERLLLDGPYPWQVKQRVAGKLGHLSNRETAGLLESVVGEATRSVVLVHLSEQNNTPVLARRAASAALVAAGRAEIDIHVAAPSEPMRLAMMGTVQ